MEDHYEDWVYERDQEKARSREDEDEEKMHRLSRNLTERQKREKDVYRKKKHFK